MLKHLKAENIEQYFLALLAGKKRKTIDKVLLGVLFFASRFYRAAIQFRLWLYENRVIRNRSIGCLVVSIGNLSCGGTGKTPVVEVFSRSISSQGRKVAILSRGYRSKQRSFSEKMVHRFAHKKSKFPRKSSLTATICCSIPTTPATNPTCSRPICATSPWLSTKTESNPASMRLKTSLPTC